MSNVSSPFERDRALGLYDMGSIAQNAFRQGSLSLRVAMPCKITEVLGNQLVDVQPLFETLPYSVGKPIKYHPIPHVPVLLPGGKDWCMKAPLAVGDVGLCVFSDRALDEFMQTGSYAYPTSDRIHDLNDAIFIPGLYATYQQSLDPTDDLVLTNGNAQIRLEKSGMFRVVNTAENGQELFDLFAQFADIAIALTQTLQAAQTITMMGPQPLWAKTQSDLAQTATKLQALAQHISTLKGK